METKLSDTERQALARETALDKFSGRYDFNRREDWRAGWDAALEWVRAQLPQSAEGAFVSCWVCRGEHKMGVKFCPVLARFM